MIGDSGSSSSMEKSLFRSLEIFTALGVALPDCDVELNWLKRHLSEASAESRDLNLPLIDIIESLSIEYFFSIVTTGRYLVGPKPDFDASKHDLDASIYDSMSDYDCSMMVSIFLYSNFWFCLALM